jgi:hypothetical protein
LCGPRIGQTDPILVILPEWLDKIYNEEKDWEIRNRPCKKHCGGKLWLAASESKAVSGHAVVKAWHGPLTEEEWAANRSRHRVEGPRMCGDSTYAWELTCVTREPVDIPIVRKKGSIGIQLGPGM